MIKISSRQTGSVHVVVIGILVIALLGGLGFVFWQNFLKKDIPAASTSARESIDTPKIEEKPKEDILTYRSEAIGIEFDYPKDWIKLECDNSYIENPQNHVYFGTTNEGLAIVDGKSTQLCGGGSDFPPQMAFVIRNARSANEERLYLENSQSVTNMMIDGKPAKKIEDVAGPDTIMQGLEVTSYIVDVGDGRFVVASYQRHPGPPSESLRDNSDASRQKFIDIVEKSLHFL